MPSIKHQASSIKLKLKLTFVLILLCALGLNGLHAQSNTEYSFRQQSTIWQQGFNNNGDPVPVLSMNCLAANGYGQWTINFDQGAGYSSSMGYGSTVYPAGWYLLANGLYAPSTHYDGSNIAKYPGCIPPGVVQCGALSPPNHQVKATANLDGSVNYVWPDPSFASFDIQYIGPSDVNISLGFLANPKPPMNIINTSAPHTLSAAITHPPLLIEADFRDEFDICSDASYLYIVWEFMNGTTKEIWVPALSIGTSTEVVGPIKVDNGSFPTITCDPRNNRGGGAPQFDIAYIDQTGAFVKTAHYNAGFTYATLDNHFWNPNVATPGQKLPYYTALHARIVRSSVLGAASTLGVYAIVNGNGGTGLIYYSPVGTATANYVAGPMWAPPIPIPHTEPLPSVYNAPIIAFANPYDNQSGWHSTDQTHCLYQYDLGSSASPRYPITIARGSDISALYPIEPDPSNADSRLVINQSGGVLEADPYGNGYVGAINQMGIHVHWVTFNAGVTTSFYARDMNRTFDEDIDENTLVTDQCTVSDGTAHGGYIGTTFAGSASQMTIWTDPNYGPPSKDGTSGLFSPRTLGLHNEHVGQLIFSGSNVHLDVFNKQVSEAGIIYFHVDLAVMPFFYFDFPGASQEVYVGPSGTFDYYGLYATHDGSGNNPVFGTPFTNGTGNEVGGGTIDMEGYTATFLNIHGGANFFTGPKTVLISNVGTINFKYEPSLYPTTSGTANPSASGLMTLLGSGQISNSTVLGNYPTPTIPNTIVITDPIITVEPSLDPSNLSPSTQFTSSGNTYSNNPTTGLSMVRFEGTTSSATYGTVDFSTDHFDAVQIRATDPANSFNVGVNGACTFTDSKDAAIWIDLTITSSLAPNYSVGIANNTFGALTLVSGSTSLQNEYWHWPTQIYADGFCLVEDNSENSQLSISGNSMTSGDGQSSGSVGTGIFLLGSNATVESNTITASKYLYGIVDEGLGGNYAGKVNGYGYLCSNHVANVAVDALYTIDFYGRLLLNEFDHASNGFFPDYFGKTTLIRNNIHDCHDAGIAVGGNAEVSFVDMTGYHPNGTTHSANDYPAFNQIQNNYFVVSGGTTGENIVNSTNSNNGGGLIIGKNANNWLSVYSDNIITTNNSDANRGNIMMGGGEGSAYLDMTNNYWGYGEVPTHHFIDPTTTSDWTYYFTETHSLTASKGIPDPGPTPPPWSCGTHPDTDYGASKVKKQPLSGESDTDSCYAKIGLCDAWINQAYTNYDEAYDTLRKYLALCPDNDNALDGLYDLGEIIGDVTQTKTMAGLLDARKWLMDERHASTRWPGWYCECVYLVGRTYNDIPAGLAIIKFLLADSQCSYFDKAWAGEYEMGRSTQIRIWQDTAKNDSLQYFDSTLPSIDMLGLDSLLKDEASLGVRPGAPQVITYFTASPNPVESGTVLSFGLTQEAYVKIELFDVLGKIEAVSGFAGVLPPGNKAVPISLAGLPSGTYFARIVTAYGEVQTVKLVKE